MRSPEPATLAGSLGPASPARFVADAAGTIVLPALLPPAAIAEPFRGRCVLLALPNQRGTIAALLALDGVARRVLLWPGDTPPEDPAPLRRAAGIDAILDRWPPPAPNPPAPNSSAAVPPRGAVATEWVLFTSGTTARPKLVLHNLQTLAGHLLGAPAPATAPVWCSFYDIRRYGGLQVLLRALLGGGSLVLSEAHEAPAQTLRRAAQAGATHFLGTPSHWRRVLLTAEAALIRPDYLRLSGEIADQTLLDRLRAAYPRARIVHAFASTEAGLVCEVADGRAGLPAALLDANPFAELELAPTEGAPSASAPGTASGGKLRARSPRNALGYLDGAIRPLRGNNGFVETGDVLLRHGDRLHFLGRDDGVINIGGQKVHPEEVEAVLQQDPQVRMCAVRARANPITGAVVAADIVAGAGAGPDLPARLRQLCRAQLPPHKVPVSIRLVPRLDMAPSGKIARAIA